MLKPKVQNVCVLLWYVSTVHSLVLISNSKIYSPLLNLMTCWTPICMVLQRKKMWNMFSSHFSKLVCVRMIHNGYCRVLHFFCQGWKTFSRADWEHFYTWESLCFQCKSLKLLLFHHFSIGSVKKNLLIRDAWKCCIVKLKRIKPRQKWSI